MTLLTVLVLYPAKTVAALVVSLTAATNKLSYYMEYDQPAVDYLTSFEMDDQKGTPLLFRTIPIGNPAPTHAGALVSARKEPLLMMKAANLW